MRSGAENSKVTILVVDDEESVGDLLKSVFAKDGYAVHVARTGMEAVSMAQEVRPDLILMDITMPGMDGYEATGLIKANPKLAETPVIFLTGKSAQEDGGKCFAKGGLTFARKPFSARHIRDLVNLTLESLDGTNRPE
jgi:CheY-like chemotaxis protein